MPIRFWDKLPFAARLLLTASVALLIAGAVMLYVSARGDAIQARHSLQTQLDNELRTLPLSMLDLVVIGDFSTLHQNLERQVKRAGLQRIAFVDEHGTLLEARDKPVMATAPAWFAHWVGLNDLKGHTQIEVGGREYGTFEVTLSPQNVINRVWTRLLQHLSILLLAVSLDFLGIWLVLRRGLQPLHALDRASQALAEGRFEERIPVKGSPEFRHVLTAFNSMAEAVESTVRSLSESEGKVSAILKSIGDGLIATDVTMRITYINPVAEALSGWSLSEARGRSVAEIFNIENALTGQAAEIPVGRVLETGCVVGLANHTVLVARDGRRHHISDSAAPVRDGEGEMVGVVMVFRDVTEPYRLRRALEDSQTRLGLALKGADLGLWDWNLQTGQVIYDERWASMLGYQLNEITQDFSTWERLLHPEDEPVAKRALDAHLRGHAPQYEAEHRMRAKSGEWRWILTRGRITQRDSQGQPIRVTGTHLDITERKRAQSEIERLAYYDHLTGLPNRRMLLERLQLQLAASRRSNELGALLFIDLDHFKHLNDTRGHSAGDLLLKEVAYRLVKNLREGDTVARLGGDEFVVLLPNLGNTSSHAASLARDISNKLRHTLSSVYRLDGGEHYLGASVGVSMFPDGEGGAEELLRHADTAMYRAKENGRNTICFFEPEMQAAMEARLEMERDLREALSREEFRIYLQAQHDAEGKLVGAEVLLRWAHPQHGLVSPARFIPLAEETGLIVPIGNWVLNNSTRLLKQLETQGKSLRLAVNVSPRQFRETDFVERVREQLLKSGADPKRLTLEITEGMLLADVGEAITRMAELERLGVRFSIDDFGTGYSSLSYLKRLPLHEIKIDRGFVADLPRDTDDAALVETILAIAWQMRLSVVAEGVENEAQLNYLKANGCDHFQGFYLGHPIPEAEFIRQLQ